MNRESPSKNNPIKDKVVSFLKDNLFFKILAVIIAVFLWAGLIIQDPTITREKVFNDVSVSVSGQETMKRNGFIVVSDLSESLSDVTLHVDVPQMQFTNATASTYNARVDLSRVSETGTQAVRIQTTNSSTYGTVSEIIPAEIEVEVEEYVSRYRIPVSIVTTGELPEGYYSTTPTLEPSRVTVSGPRSLVERVLRAEATLDFSTLPAREGTVSTAITFRLVDASGEEIKSDLVEVTSELVLLDSVVAEQTLYPYKTFELSDLNLVTGTPADGYEVKSVTISPNSVTGAGRSESIDALDTLFADGQVDATGLSESATFTLRLRRPSEIQYLSTDSMTVEVEIGPVITERTFEDVRVTLTGVASNLRGKLDSSTATVVVKGEALTLQSMRASSLTLVCDASGLIAGEWNLPVLCTTANVEAEIIPAEIRVTLTER